MARFLLAWIAAVVLIGDGLVLVGFTGQVPGQAVAVPPSSVGTASAVPPAGSVPSAGVTLPSAPKAGATGGSARTPVQPPTRQPSAPNQEAADPDLGHGHGFDLHHHWPTSIPDPEDFTRYHHGPSPFTRRCRDGQISAEWCYGFPG